MADAEQGQPRDVEEVQVNAVGIQSSEAVGGDVVGALPAAASSASQSSISHRGWVDLALLSACWALEFSCLTASVATSTNVGRELAPSRFFDTMPVASMMYGMALSNVPVGVWLERLGRKRGFSLGAVIGIGGGLVCWAGVEGGSFVTVVLGSALIGTAIMHGQLYRFAALLFVPGPEHHSKAISSVLTGGCAGALLGPEFSKRMRTALDTEFAGIYLTVAAVNVAVLVLLQFVRFPDVRGADVPGAPKPAAQPTPLWHLVGRAETLTATFVGGLVYFGMVFIMSPCPLSMKDEGFSFDDSSLVIQVHMLCMFAPSFWIGSLIQRWGFFWVKVGGVLAMLLSGAVLLTGRSLAIYLVGLILLGFGWNGLFMSATGMVARSFLGMAPPDKTRVVTFNDLVVFLTGGTGILLSGSALDALGWDAMQYVQGGITLLILAATCALPLWRRRHPLPVDGPAGP